MEYRKCQNLSLEEQYEFGVRFFDLRIRFDEEATPYFAHGLLEFHEKAVTNVLAFLDQKQDCIVNLVMESFGKVKDSQDRLFIDFCKQAEDQYKYITFVGGWSKYPESGHSLYSFAPKKQIREVEVYKVFFYSTNPAFYYYSEQGFLNKSIGIHQHADAGVYQ